MSMLTLLGLSLASPHGFQSGSSPAHGYSSMASASFVVNDSTHDPKLIHALSLGPFPRDTAATRIQPTPQLPAWRGQ